MHESPVGTPAVTPTLAAVPPNAAELPNVLEDEAEEEEDNDGETAPTLTPTAVVAMLRSASCGVTTPATRSYAMETEGGAERDGNGNEKARVAGTTPCATATSAITTSDSLGYVINATGAEV